MHERESLIDDARKALPAVVQVLVEGYDAQSVHSLLNPRFTIPAEWGGSGFFVEVDGERGYVLTNSHVVANAKKIKVMSMLTSEELFHVDLVGLVHRGDPDIALLRLPPNEVDRFELISGRSIPSLELGDSQNVDRGIRVKAIGYPFGMPEPNISGGEISNFLSGDDETSERLVTDAPINPGNSGGPAIVEGGKVIGINTSIIVGANNIGFITPIHFFHILLPSFLGRSEPGLTDLGAHLQPNSPAMAGYLNIPVPEGLIVSRLVPGGMLARAGLHRGDILLAVGKYRFDRYGNALHVSEARRVSILDVAREIPSGTEVTITFFRKGAELQKVAVASTLPTFGVEYQPIVHSRQYLVLGGMLLQQLSYEIVEALSGALDENYWKEVEASKYSEKPFLVVTHIDSDSQADDLCLGMGEVLAKVDGQVFDGDLQQLSALLKHLVQTQSHVLFEFRSGSFGYFALDHEFDDLEVSTCCNE